MATAVRLRRSSGLPLTYLAAILVVGVTVVPLIFVILGGFRTTAQINEAPAGLPHPVVWDNYRFVLSSPDFWRFLRNSAVIAIIATVVAVSWAAMAAFALSRYTFRGREGFYTRF